MKCLSLIAFFAAVFTQCHCGAETGTPVWNDTRLSRFQDAWKSINQKPHIVYYLVKTNYDQDDVWGQNFSCLTVQEIQKNTTAKSGVSAFRFMNGTGEEEYNVNETVEAVKTGNYPKENAIRYTLADGSNLTDSLIFTDGKKCDVFHVPYKNNGSGCELWVRKEYADKIPDCCLFIFETFCGPENYYDVYTKEKCANATHMKANADAARF